MSTLSLNYGHDKIFIIVCEPKLEVKHRSQQNSLPSLCLVANFSFLCKYEMNLAWG